MKRIALGIVGLLAILHGYIAWFEIFAWETRGPEIFSVLAPELFAPTKSMAANQGLYNAFLGAGLLWALLIKDQHWQKNVATCFLLFVFVAGVFGAFTVTPKILFIQAVPSALGLIALHLGSRQR